MVTSLFSCDDLDDRLQVLSWTEDSQEIEVVTEVLSTSASCPSCQNRSHRKHSRYTRRVADLPMNGKNVHLLILTNKWFCDHLSCATKVFTERDDWLPSYNRNTQRAEELLRTIAFSTNAKMAERISRQTGIPTSHDTFLFVALKWTPQHLLPFVALDDFAIRKRYTYGTLVIDLEKRCPIDLFPGRTQEDVKKWLQQYPHIQLVSRDGSKTYASGITGASGDITQVSDRWHILKQLFEAVKQTLNNRLPSKWRPKKDLNKDSSRSFTRQMDQNRREGEERRWLDTVGSRVV